MGNEKHINIRIHYSLIPKRPKIINNLNNASDCVHFDNATRHVIPHQYAFHQGDLICNKDSAP
jgi:hypothetical protein